MKLGPALAVIIISLLLTLLTNFIYKLVTDQDMMRALKTELKTLQNEMKELKDQPEKFMAHQKRAMEKNLEYMKRSMKPTLFTFIPLLLIFGWLRLRFAGMGDLIIWGFNIPLLGKGLGWLGIYFWSAVIFSFITRKLLKIY